MGRAFRGPLTWSSQAEDGRREGEGKRRQRAAGALAPPSGLRGLQCPAVTALPLKLGEAVSMAKSCSEVEGWNLKFICALWKASRFPR